MDDAMEREQKLAVRKSDEIARAATTSLVADRYGAAERTTEWGNRNVDQATKPEAGRNSACPERSDKAQSGASRRGPTADAMDKYVRDPDTREIVVDARITLFEAILLYTYWDGLLLFSECDPGPSMSELRYELYTAARRRAVCRALKPLLGDALNEYPPKGASLDLLRKTCFHIDECFPSRLAEMPSLMRDVKRMIALRLAPPLPGETPEQGSRRMRSEDDRINEETSIDRKVMRTGREPEPLTFRERDGVPDNAPDASPV
jgi:hypothetical protein